MLVKIQIKKTGKFKNTFNLKFSKKSILMIFLKIYPSMNISKRCKRNL